MSSAVRSLETDVLHFPYCVFETLSHDGRWLKVMPHRLLSGKYNLPETKGINLRMLESTALSAISITEFLPDSNDGKECVDHRKTDYLDVEAII